MWCGTPLLENWWLSRLLVTKTLLDDWASFAVLTFIVIDECQEWPAELPWWH
jgi:hypothetical protein